MWTGDSLAGISGRQETAQAWWTVRMSWVKRTRRNVCDELWDADYVETVISVK